MLKTEKVTTEDHAIAPDKIKAEIGGSRNYVQRRYQTYNKMVL